MSQQKIADLSQKGRLATQQNQVQVLQDCALEIIKLDEKEPEGHFLNGLFFKRTEKPVKAADAFSKVLQLNPDRYDAAIELANQYVVSKKNAEAVELLDAYCGMLTNSPRYLDMAGTCYSTLGMPEKSWPLYKEANKLQPGIDLIEGNLAACAVFLGKIDDAEKIYKKLLKKFPAHQRNHYHLSRLKKATDKTHIREMQHQLHSNSLTPDKNIFLYFALAKEFEDLEEWDEAFRYYKIAGNAVSTVSKYKVSDDIAIIDKIIETCNTDWYLDQNSQSDQVFEQQPIFIVGLPRTGTTLTERILASHSQITSLGETSFIQAACRMESKVETKERLDVAIVESLTTVPMQNIANRYMESVNYRLKTEPFFIDKLPFNFLYLGYIAKAFPKAKIVHLKRHPMDACFSMYKQVFTNWVYLFSYHQDNLGKYYLAYARIMDHWRELLGDRLVEVEYESLVGNLEPEVRTLLAKLDLEFEDGCLNFEKNKAASTTASSVQVREKAHTRSVGRWRNYAKQLQPLKEFFEKSGVDV